MSVKAAEMPVAAVDIPPVLPIVDRDETREKMLLEAAAVDYNQPKEANSAVETNEEELDELIENPKASKRKIAVTFVIFVVGFLLLIGAMAWFFGMGAFAAEKPQSVDRTAKMNSAHPAAPVTEEDKLKMALNLVAEKNPSVKAGENSGSSQMPVAARSSVDIPPAANPVDLNKPVTAVPDSLSESKKSDATSRASETTIEQQKTPVSIAPGRFQSSKLAEKNNNSINGLKSDAADAPAGRSLFFGSERKEIAAPREALPAKDTKIVSSAEKVNFTNPAKPLRLPFGSLLPVRLLGAVYTLRLSGGLVRMELTRRISGKNYSYPAGTVLVGSLRGSEEKRAFISVTGLIDPASGAFLKFEGEVMGSDGASGMSGRRRKIKSAWSRVLGGLAQAGTVAIGALGNRRSGGGTVIISDSTAKTSGVLSEELAGATGNARSANEFVEISAGTTGFVLVTNLPGEFSGTNLFAQNSASPASAATGLSNSELADLFSEGNPEKVRAALPRMTPQFRVLAEKYLETEGK